MAEIDGAGPMGPGATLADGRYRLRERLGAGGMATVWLADDERLGRPVAIKLIADTLAGDENWLRRFSREARAAAALSHRGVVPVFDYGVQDGRPFLVMEYIAGGNLAQRLQPESAPTTPRRPGSRRRAVPPAPTPPAGAVPEPATLARELLEALAGVHAAGILHRDVKPANLLIDTGGHVRLTDFGIAQTRDATSLTQTGMVVGTLRYIAPEVAAGEPATAASDLYSAGMVIRQVAGDPPSPALGPLIDALTAQDPHDRPRSADEALALLDGETAQTRVAPPRAAPRAAAAAARTAATTVRPPTGATLAQPVATPAAAWRAANTGLPRLPRHLVAVLAGLIVLVIAIALIASSGGSGSSAPRTPSPAPAGASISRQISALEQIVTSARRH